MRFLVVRLWTFERASDLASLATALGFGGKASLRDLSSQKGPKTARSLKEGIEAGRQFVSAECRTDRVATVACEALAELRVSPLDAVFPVIDWSKGLGRQDRSLRGEFASHILGLVLRGLTSYPSTLTLRIELAADDVTAHALAGDWLTALPDALNAIKVRVSGAGYLSSGVYSPLPPETVAHRALQIELLRIGFEAIDPIMIMHRDVARRVGRLSAGWNRVDGEVASVVFQRDDLSPRPLTEAAMSGVLGEFLSDAAYRKLEETNGLIEAPGCAILLADRSTHPLAEQALGAMQAIGVELVPLRQRNTPWSTPSLLLASDAAATLRSALHREPRVLEAVRLSGLGVSDLALAILERALSSGQAEV